MLTGLNHITLAVSDLDRSFGFYVETLGFTPRARWVQGAYLSLGGLWLCLSLELSADGAQPAADYTHIALSVTLDDLPDCAEKVAQCGAVIWKANASEGDSLYFLDPDGHKLEIHCGDLKSRLAAISSEPYDGLELFDS